MRYRCLKNIRIQYESQNLVGMLSQKKVKLTTERKQYIIASVVKRQTRW